MDDSVDDKSDSNDSTCDDISNECTFHDDQPILVMTLVIVVRNQAFLISVIITIVMIILMID